MKANTAKKCELDLTEVTLVEIKRYLDTRKGSSPSFNHYEKEQKLRVDLAYEIGLLKSGAALARDTAERIRRQSAM